MSPQIRSFHPQIIKSNASLILLLMTIHGLLDISATTVEKRSLPRQTRPCQTNASDECVYVHEDFQLTRVACINNKCACVSRIDAWGGKEQNIELQDDGSCGGKESVMCLPRFKHAVDLGFDIVCAKGYECNGLYTKYCKKIGTPTDFTPEPPSTLETEILSTPAMQDY